MHIDALRACRALILGTPFVLFSCASLSGGPSQAGLLASPIQSVSIRAAENIVFEISPAIELLAGIQSKTSWIRNGNGASELGPYAGALSAFFSAYRDDEAVRRSQAFTDVGFTYDAPPAFALALGERFEPPVEGWSPYLRGRARGAAKLEAFRRSFVALARKSDFADFFEKRRPDYERWLKKAAAGAQAERVAAWLGAFYGSKDNPVYHFVLAPAMFPSGGYGFSRTIVEGAEKRLHIYQVVRADPSGSEEPALPSGLLLAELGLHEFGHSFVNPAIGDRFAETRDRRLEALFLPVQKTMKAMAYGHTVPFLNELVLRAAVIHGRRDLGFIEEGEVPAALERERQLGFYCVGAVYEALKDYSARKDIYPTFDSFAPELLARLAADSERLLAERERAAAELLPLAGFREDFEGQPMADGLPAGWAAKVGASILKDGGSSRVLIEAEGALSSRASLRLSSDASDSRWQYVYKPVAVQSGTLGLRCLARPTEVRAEGGQYENCYVGFLILNKNGKKEFKVRGFSGTEPTTAIEILAEINPARVESIEVVIFLSMSGDFRVDDIEVGYR